MRIAGGLQQAVRVSMTVGRLTSAAQRRRIQEFGEWRHQGIATMKYVCLFDIDGTLLNTGGAGQRGMERALASAFNLDDLSH
ncbi:MAG: hypothetical protein DWQ29_01940, partial [Planctomycetota bacterium]